MSLTLGRQGGIAQPLKKRTVGQINIAHVYDGVNHIWPTSVIHFSDFTSVQLRYIWGNNDGRDLDTKSYYVNSPINSLNYVAVGWSWNLSQIPYLYWGGDNVNSGAECIMFNIESMIELEDKMPDIMKMNLCANWYGSKGIGNVTIECTAYKGGVIVYAWQLTNVENDINKRGEFLFPTSDGKIYLFWSVFDQSILNLPERKVRKWIYINCRFLQMLQNVKVFWQHRKKCISRNLQSVHMCQP